MAKTDLEIVTDVNDLARTMLRFLGTGYEAPAGHQFWKAADPRSQTAWQRAVDVYEQITHSEVHDALLAVEEDEEAADVASRKQQLTPQAALERIASRLRGEWFDPSGDLESDIAGVIRAVSPEVLAHG